jgi:hypothetical protein
MAAFLGSGFGGGMMGWWWKLSVEWPCAVGDWLWKFLVAMPVASLREVTVRKIFTALALAVLVAMFVQTAPADLAYLLAGDMLTYLEAIAIVWLLAARGRGRDLVRMFGHMARSAVRRARKALAVAFRRGEPRRRSPSRARRLRRLDRRRNTEDGPGLVRARRLGAHRRLIPSRRGRIGSSNTMKTNAACYR